MRLKKNIGKLQAGSYGLITHLTPASVIDKLLKKRPDLSQYFEDGKAKKATSKKSTED
jgi:hypothetical protein